MPKTAANDHQQIDGFDIFMQIVLTAMILLPPLAMGAVGPWARSVLCALAISLVAAWLLQGARRGELRVVRSRLWFFILAFFALALFQLVPLSESVLGSLSPAAWRVYAAALADYPASGEARTLSLSPYATQGELIRIAIPAIVLFITANVVRTRRQVIALIVALAAIGTFEALYGFAEQFSGNKHIFWMPRQYHLAAVTSTFHNKNHFAGLLEMIIPVSLGLLVAIGRGGEARVRNRPSAPVKSNRWNFRSFLSGLSSPTVGRQIVLSASATVMTVAIFFSLSRAGIVCAIASLAGFFFFLWSRKGTRRYAFVLMLISVIALSVTAGIGMELVVTRMEEAVSGQSTSWIDRLDLAKSATGLIRDYPLAGTGLGTFGVAFPAYQSPRFGDAWADYLHNDWLQAFCETGLVGGAILMLAAVVLVAALLRSAANPKNSFCRWIAIGGLLGVCAMLLHSFFDYNLSKITSNGIIFAIIAGLPFGAENIRNAGEAFRKPRYWNIPVGPIPARAAVAALAFAAIGSGAYFSIPPAAADIHFNRYLAASTSGAGADDYFFIPTSRAESGHGNAGRSGGGLHAAAPDFDSLEKALALQPRNPRYLFYRARLTLDSAAELVRREAKERARTIAGEDAVRRLNPREFDRIVGALEKGVEMQAEREPFLAEARRFLLRSIEAAPTVARYHIALAGVLAELKLPEEDILDRARAGLSLAPNKPRVLYDAGRIYISQRPPALGSEEYGPTASKAFEYFRMAIFADASYSGRVYRLIEGFAGGGSALSAVTPRTIPAYERLSSALWQSGDWESVLACVDEIEELIGHQSTHSSPAGFFQRDAHASEGVDAGDYDAARHLRGAVGYDNRDPVVIRLSASRRRCEVLAILGRWEERSEAVTRYRKILREHLASSLEESRRLRDMGRTREALAMCLDGLEQNWDDPDLLLEAAELASLPGSLAGIPQGNGPLDHLYSLIINDKKLSPAQYERALTILDGVEPRTQTEETLATFIRGAGAVLAGRAGEGSGILGAFLKGEEDEAEAWRQRHLIRYYLGRAYEVSGKRGEAIEAYRLAVKIVPAHRPSLLRLSGLGVDTGPRMAELTPEVPCNVNFGGKVTLLGYTIGGKTEREEWFITYYWRFNDGMAEGYRPIVHFRDGDWNTIFRNDHRIRAGGEFYPIDFPLCGEVVVEKRRLERDPSVAEYMVVGIWTPEPSRFAPRILYREDGGGWARIGLMGV